MKKMEEIQEEMRSRDLALRAMMVPLPAASAGVSMQNITSFDGSSQARALLGKEGANLACLAAEHGHAESLRALAAIGVDMNEPSEDGSNPLMVAAENGHSDVISTLGDLSVDLNASMDGGVSACYIAASYGHVEVRSLLL